MQSMVSFEKIIEVFLHVSSDYFVLLKDSILKISAPTKEQAKELRERGLYIIPKKTPEFEKKLREEFTYEIKDAKLAEKYFESAIHSNHESFENFLSSHALMTEWHEHEKKYSKNALINWLERSGINLPGQKLVPEITLSIIEPLMVADEMKAFKPVKCNSCQATSGFTVTYFKTDVPCENLLMEKETQRLIAEKGYLHLHFLGKAKRDLVAAAKCHKCYSSELEWDFT